MRNSYKAIALVSIMSLNACATIIEGSNQNVNVNTTPPTAATCDLNNGNISTVTTPGTAMISKSKNTLNIACKDTASGAKGSKNVPSEFAPWTVASVLFGILGIGIDAASGAWFKYPENVTVPMETPVAIAPEASAPQSDNLSQATPAAPATANAQAQEPASGTQAAPAQAPQAPAIAAPTAAQ